MMKNKIASILIIISLGLPVLASPEDINSTVSNHPTNELIKEDSTNLEEFNPFADIPEVSNTDKSEQEEIKTEETDTTPYKQPVSKKKIIKKFILAMLGVGISSVFIFGILSIYNKIRNYFINTEDETIKRETPLETPESIQEAVRTFVDKTKWDN
ncbi:hypothetical protein IJ750_06495 [bacterium]|nr:hypothetical protein [bacterium]